MQSDYKYGLIFMESHGMSVCNEMGDHLLEFLSKHDLLAANTCFGETIGLQGLEAKIPYLSIHKLTMFCVVIGPSPY